MSGGSGKPYNTDGHPKENSGFYGGIKDIAPISKITVLLRKEKIPQEKKLLAKMLSAAVDQGILQFLRLQASNLISEYLDIPRSQILKDPSADVPSMRISPASDTRESFSS